MTTTITDNKTIRFLTFLSDPVFAITSQDDEKFARGRSRTDRHSLRGSPFVDNARFASMISIRYFSVRLPGDDECDGFLISGGTAYACNNNVRPRFKPKGDGGGARARRCERFINVKSFSGARARARIKFKL